MSALLQISDPHFGTEQPHVMRALEQLAHALSPAVVVLSGDITQRATNAQFAAARAFVDRLAAPAVLAVPGNHDIPLFQLGARFFSPYGRYRRAFGDTLEPVFESPDWLVVGVNTTRWWRHSDGVVSAEQTDRVAAALASASPAQLRIVVTHQPVMVTRSNDLSNRLHGRDKAVPRWCAAGADLILGGHIHLPFVRPLDEAFAGCTPSTAWAVQAGTALSTRMRAGHPNSVNVIHSANIQDIHDTPGGRSCRVERWDFSAASAAFECAEVLRLSLATGAARP